MKPRKTKPRIPVIEDGRQQGQPIIGFKDEPFPPNHHETWLEFLKVPQRVRGWILPGLFIIVIAITKAATSPVTETVTAPAEGQVMSNRFIFSANASSLAADITRVEFYETHLWTNPATWQVFLVTNLVGTALPKPGSPRAIYIQ